MIDNIRSKLELYFKNVTYSPSNNSQLSTQALVVEHLELPETAKSESHVRSESQVRVEPQEKRENQKKDKKHYPVIYNS